jgi:hypothetical protein
MADDALPAEVRGFLGRYIESVEQLEILLLVASNPSRAWNVQEVYGVIRSSEGSVAHRLASFAREGLLQAGDSQPPTYSLAAVSGDLHAAISKTAEVYQTRRVRVIEAIFKSELDPIQGFANAFKLRKD